MNRIVKVVCTKDERNKGRPWLVRWVEISFDSEKKGACRAFAHRKERDIFAAELRLGLVDTTRMRPSDSMTLEAYLKRFMESKRHEVRPRTMEPYEQTVEQLLTHFGGSTPLPAIGPIDAQEFIDGLTRQDGRSGELSDSTRYQRRKDCKAIFEQAVDWELIDRSPFGKLKMKQPKGRPWHYVAPDAYLRLVGLEKLDLSAQARYALAYTGALRFGEIFNVTWQDFDFERGLVKIENRPGTTQMPEFHVKDFETRIVELPEHTLRLLSALWTARDGVGDQSPFPALDDRRYGLVVKKWQRYRAEGRPWDNRDMMNNVGRDMKRHLQKAEIVAPEGVSLSFHTLRKCCITNWAKAGLSMGIVKDLAGHESMNTTKKYYLQTDADDLSKAAAISQGLISKALLGRAK